MSKVLGLRDVWLDFGTKFVRANSKTEHIPVRCPNCKKARIHHAQHIQGFRDDTGRWWMTCDACSKTASQGEVGE